MRQPIEDRIAIRLPDLKHKGYLYHSQHGELAWRIGGSYTASVGIHTEFDEEYPEEGGTLTIDYRRSNGTHQEVIDMVYVPSNLGRGGGTWYFVCPQTEITCRVLLMSSSGFVSRHAEGGLRYRAQLLAQGDRESDGVMREIKRLERKQASVLWFSKPRSKRCYAGRPTRPMIRFRRLNGLG